MIPPRALAAFLFTAIAIAQPFSRGRDWEHSKPENGGYSSKRLAALKAYLATIDTTAMMVVHKGKVIFEYGDVSRVPPFPTSVRKSLLAILYGKYVSNGKINLDATLEELGIDDVGGLLPVERRATIRHLLTMRSGVFHKNSNFEGAGGDDLLQAPPRGSQQPGTYSLFNNWDFNVAGYIFEKQTGLDTFDALQSDLGEPLGLQDFARPLLKKEDVKPSVAATVSKYPANPVSLSARDMARIGQLLLQRGKWDGRQVVAADWITRITSLVTPVDQLNPPSERPYALGMLWGVGYGWLVWDDHGSIGPFQGAFSAMGTVGQHITILPQLDLVVTHMTLPAEPGKGSRFVRPQQYHGALVQLINARCRGACP